MTNYGSMMTYLKLLDSKTEARKIAALVEAHRHFVTLNQRYAPMPKGINAHDEGELYAVGALKWERTNNGRVLTFIHPAVVRWVESGGATRPLFPVTGRDIANG